MLQEMGSEAYKKDIKIAVFLHLYLHDLWEEILSYLKNLEGLDYKLFVSLAVGNINNEIMTKEILSKFPNAFVGIYPNRGADVGPFLLLLKESYKDASEYDYFLKIHTKKSLARKEVSGERWRRILFKYLLGDKKQVDICLRLLNNKNIGMLGPGIYIQQNKNGGNQIFIDKLREKLNCHGGKHYIQGTMFWAKYYPFKKYFPPKIIDEIYELMPEGYHKNETIMHGLERVFGYIIENDGLVIKNSSHRLIYQTEVIFMIIDENIRRTKLFMEAIINKNIGIVGKCINKHYPDLYKTFKPYFPDKK